MHVRDRCNLVLPPACRVLVLATTRAPSRSSLRRLFRQDDVISAQGEGEIVVQTPALMLGYFQRPDLTARALLDGWYRTGDIGAIDASGIIALKGRARDEINRGGVKVHPLDGRY
jgi:long-subunit acyl-CoA synthetase (AMP-forming)